MRNEIRRRAHETFRKLKDRSLPVDEQLRLFEKFASFEHGPWTAPSVRKKCTLRGACVRASQLAVESAAAASQSRFEFSAENVASDLMLAIFFLAHQIDDLSTWIPVTATRMIDGSFGRDRITASASDAALPQR